MGYVIIKTVEQTNYVLCLTVRKLDTRNSIEELKFVDLKNLKDYELAVFPTYGTAESYLALVIYNCLDCLNSDIKIITEEELELNYV